MKTRRYFREQVLRKRPYIGPEWCEKIVANPLRRDVQLGGRILRVVTLEDGETLHDAFPDRNFSLPTERVEEGR